MRILMVNYEFPPIGGGAGNANLCLLKEMATAEGVDIDLVTSYAGKGLAVEKFADNITIYKVGIAKKNLHHWRKSEVLFWMFNAWPVYKKLVKENNYDLSHGFFAFPSGWFCWRTRKKVPYVISLRGSDVPGYNDTLGFDYFVLSNLFKKIWAGASSMVANSNGLALLAKKFMPELDIDVIPNGVFVDEFSQLNICKKTDRTLKLLMVGRLVNRKRIDIAIEAVKLLKDMDIDVELIVAGDGVMNDQLKELAKSLDIESCVSFSGLVTKQDIPAFYAKADIFIMCSEHEGMSNSLLEAMASSLPIITSNCEGVCELIDGNGIVLSEMTPGTLASAVQTLVNDKEIRVKMASISKERAELFSWKKVAEKYLEQYRKIGIK